MCKEVDLSFLRHFAKRHPGQWSWTEASTGQLEPRLQHGGRFLSDTLLENSPEKTRSLEGERTYLESSC